MTNGNESQGISHTATAIFAVCLLLLLAALFVILSPFLSAFLWAAALCVVFFPAYRWLRRRLGDRSSLAASLSCVLIFLLIVLPVTALSVVVVRQAVSIYQSLEGSLEKSAGGASGKIAEWKVHPTVRWLLEQSERRLGTGVAELQGYARDAVGISSSWIVSRGAALLAGVGGMLFKFLLIFIMLFFLFRDGPAIMDLLREASPLPEEYGASIIRKFEDVSYATFVGSILTALVQGAAASILFWALDVHSPLFWGAIVAFVSLLPILGAFLVWIPMSAYLVFTGEMTRGIILLCVGGLLVSSIDNVLKPMIIQGRTNIHPLLVFLSVMGGMQVFGFLGVLLGPLIVAVFITSLEFYLQHFRKNLGP